MKGQINNKQAHRSTTNKKELNKKLITDDSLDSRLREELEKYTIEEIVPLPPNRDYLQNMKMKKNFDWLNRMRK